MAYRGRQSRKEARGLWHSFYHYGSKDALLESRLTRAGGRCSRPGGGRPRGGKTGGEEDGARNSSRLVVKDRASPRGGMIQTCTEASPRDTRSPHSQDEIDEIGQAFASLVERIVHGGPGKGNVSRRRSTARLAGEMLYGRLRGGDDGGVGSGSCRRRRRRSLQHEHEVMRDDRSAWPCGNQYELQ